MPQSFVRKVTPTRIHYTHFSHRAHWTLLYQRPQQQLHGLYRQHQLHQRCAALMGVVFRVLGVKRCDAVAGLGYYIS